LNISLSDNKMKSIMKKPLETSTSNTDIKISLQEARSKTNLLSGHKSTITIEPVNDSQEISRVHIKNNHILINQLHYCRFIYYLIRNLNYLLISPKSRNKLTLILFRHLLKLIKNLSDPSKNWFRLSDWTEFK